MCHYRHNTRAISIRCLPCLSVCPPTVITVPAQEDKDISYRDKDFPHLEPAYLLNHLHIPYLSNFLPDLQSELNSSQTSWPQYGLSPMTIKKCSRTSNLLAPFRYLRSSSKRFGLCLLHLSFSLSCCEMLIYDYLSCLNKYTTKPTRSSRS